MGSCIAAITMDNEEKFFFFSRKNTEKFFFFEKKKQKTFVC